MVDVRKLGQNAGGAVEQLVVQLKEDVIENQLRANAHESTLPNEPHAAKAVVPEFAPVGERSLRSNSDSQERLIHQLDRPVLGDVLRSRPGNRTPDLVGSLRIVGVDEVLQRGSESSH